MYEYSPGFLAAPIPSRRRRSGARPHPAGNTAVIDPRTGARCQATERRIHPVVEPPASALVDIAPQYLFDSKRPKKLHFAAYDAYKKLKAAAEGDRLSARLLTIVSGYRSVAHQKQLWEAALKQYKRPEIARRWVAPPGGSPHHTGRAIDFWLGIGNSSRNAPAQRSLPAYGWLVCNAAKFGFTPYVREPWHWEYNPPDFATRAAAPAAPSEPQPASDVSEAAVRRRHRQSQPQPQPTAAGPLRLIGREPQPPTETLYVNIVLGGEGPSRPGTGIFIPTGYRVQPQVDLILYLHGFKGSHPSLTIAQYWNVSRFPFRGLREGVNSARKNIILAAPTLGPRSQTGRLVRPGGLDWYLEQVMSALRQFGPHRGPATVGNIILACHSGGGWPMRQLATSQERYAANIRECWGFDCLYNRGDESVWAEWAKRHPQNQLYVYYLDTTAAKSQALQQQGVPNVSVARSSARAHDYVPAAHWTTRIQGAPFLRDR